MGGDDDESEGAFQLLTHADGDLHSLTGIGRRPCLLGRDEGVDVQLRHPAVSRHHALIWTQGGEVLVRDLGSALGTRVGSRRLSAGDATPVAEGEEIVLADRARLVWGRSAEVSVEPAPVVAPLLAFDTGVGLYDSTLPPDDEGAISITLTCGPSGPREARLEDGWGHELKVRGESRVVMLFILAEQTQRMRRALAESAWVDDRKLAIGLWGSKGPQLPASRLNTVISRIRIQLRKAFLAPELLQKEAGRTRLGPTVGAIVINRKGI